MPTQPAGNIIYDLGAHYGEDTYFYLKKGFRVVAVEPNPTLARIISGRLDSWIRRGRLVVEQAAISKRKGVAELFVNRTWDSWTSLASDIGSRGSAGSETIQVRTVALDDLIERHGDPYFVKIDIEGMDHLPLASLENVATPPRYVSVENGLENLRRQLVKLGYSRFKWVNQAHVTRQRLPFFAREGRFCLHRFRYGCSGAFGDEAPGRWMTLEEVQPLIDAYWNQPTEARSAEGWYDLHAKLD